MLVENDIIFLKSGMNVMCDFYSENLTVGNSKFSEWSLTQVVQVGFRYRNNQDVTMERKEIQQKILNIFADYKGLRPDPDIVRRFVVHQVRNPRPVELFIAEGEYLVTNVANFEGYNQVTCCTLAPDAYHPNVRVYFYQLLVGHLANNDLIEATRKLF
jgi:hypothetical protein